MALSETLHGLWDWVKKVNWVFASWLTLFLSLVLLLAPRYTSALKFLKLEGIVTLFDGWLGLSFLISLFAVVWHIMKLIVKYLSNLRVFVAIRISRNIEKLGKGSKRLLREMYENYNSSSRISKTSAEFEVLSRLGLIHCACYAESGVVHCELDGRVIGYLDRHKEILDAFPEPIDYPF